MTAVFKALKAIQRRQRGPDNKAAATPRTKIIRLLELGSLPLRSLELLVEDQSSEEDGGLGILRIQLMGLNYSERRVE